MMSKSFKSLLVQFPENISYLYPGPGKLIVRFINPEETEKKVGDIIIPHTVKMSQPQELLKTAVVIQANYSARDVFSTFYAEQAQKGNFGQGSLLYLNGLSGVHFQRLDPAIQVISEGDMDRMYGIISFQEILMVDQSRRYELTKEGWVKGLDPEADDK